MSTRCNVILKNSWETLYFYRHSDGYPEVTKKSLEVFMGWLKEGKIRNNPGQAGGWLIILGAQEYNVYRGFDDPKKEYGTPLNTPIMSFLPGGEVGETIDWKVGAYEPTDDIHGDIEFLYIIDMDKKTLSVKRTGFDKYSREALEKKKAA